MALTAMVVGVVEHNRVWMSLNILSATPVKVFKLKFQTLLKKTRDGIHEYSYDNLTITLNVGVH
jgi:hypothetical protein